MLKIFRTWKIIAILYSLLAILVLPYSANSAPTFINAVSPDLPDVARGIPMGGAIKVFDLDLDEIGSSSLELKRFTVFGPGAQLIVDNNYSVAPPTDAYFRGHVTELPDSIVVLAVPEKGAIRGIITDAAGVWLLAGNSGHSAPGLTNRKINLETELKGKPFKCSHEEIVQNTVDLLPTSGKGGTETVSLPANVTHTAQVAVETDYEYYAMFGNVDDAYAYMADLFAYASTVYEMEVNTNLVISWSRLWTGGKNSDPWDGPYPHNTNSALYEFQDYWNSGSDFNIPTSRTIAHMLSGKSLGGGSAYISVLCYSYYGDSTNYDFGLSASLSGNFNISNPSVVWDILVVTHEIGHNFSSYHSHDYCGIGGNSNPVDLCWDSADCGSKVGLPGIDTLSGGTTLEKPGTIMSYCHLLSGGYSNISFTLGKDHIYGIDAFRIPNVMKNHVTASASSFPDCLALDNSNSILTVNKTGGGNGLVTSIPEGINCGANCSANFPKNETVTLTTVTDPGSEFLGWSGDCTADGQVTMTAGKTCTATFNDIDLDNDGINDALDLCPGTPAGESVNADGCSLSQLDSDNDGISDAVDICPDTPDTEIADASGCSASQRDSDNDGVSDAADQCPGTPAGESVNADGCSLSQLDSDNDGISDAVDICPDTPDTETADANGCSGSQRDSDNDGVSDAADQCPGTPAGESVNTDGCSLSQLDTDNDGVSDAADQCPGTPAGESVNAAGCSLFQLDSDNDGISDAVDICPETPDTEIADANGCSGSQRDSDNDGIPDSEDNCPSDPDKSEPAQCGCRVADTDTDADGTLDCNDSCSDDPLKTEPGICGCGVADTDTDGDGTADCNDQCPIDAANDADSDGVCGDIDNCPNIFNPNQKDSDKNGIGDICDSCNFYLIPNKNGGAAVICL